MSQQLGIAALILLAAVVGAAIGILHTRKARHRIRTADAAQIAREVRHIRAGQLAPAAAPDPALTLHRREAIDTAARATARADHRQGRRRANPYPRNSRAAACWALAYCDEWNQLVPPCPAPPARPELHA